MFLLQVGAILAERSCPRRLLQVCLLSAGLRLVCVDGCYKYYSAPIIFYYYWQCDKVSRRDFDHTTLTIYYMGRRRLHPTLPLRVSSRRG